MCLFHKWFYVKSSDGTKHPVTGDLVKREDRFCQICGKTQIKLSQFARNKEEILVRKTGRFLRSKWVTFTQGDLVDSITMSWLKHKTRHDS
jgi:hypothetical protein